MPERDVPKGDSPRSTTERLREIDLDDLDALRRHLETRLAHQETPRWNPDPDDVKRSVMKLALTLVELIRQLMERQAIRRMEAQTLTAEEIEALGAALMQLEQTVHDLARQAGLDPSELNLDLGPLGKLL